MTMRIIQLSDRNPESSQPAKLLLGMMPFWTPAIPPLGISCLKSHLTKEKYSVRTFDANMDETFREIYDRYFGIVDDIVPKRKKGNFFNIGMEVMRNHMMAHLHQDNDDDYLELVGELFDKTFNTDLTVEQIQRLNANLDIHYERVASYITSLLNEEQPDVLGLSVFSGNLASSTYAFKIGKQHRPDLITVMGGGTFAMELAEGTPNYERYLQQTSDYIDKMFIGEAETTLLRYLQGKLDPEQRVYTLADVDRETINIDEAGIPDFSDLNVHSYPQLGSYTSRSCPYDCSFCSETVHWGVYRKKQPRTIVNEMKRMYRQHGVQLFMMGDSLLNIVVDGLAEEFLKEDVVLYWDGYLRADPPVCDPDNALRWRRGGLYRARLGVETGSTRMLDVMNKKITVDQIRDSVNALAAAGVKTTTYWICGHPEETEEDFQMTLDLIEELSDVLYEAECNPFKYHLREQVDSDKWMSQYKRVTLYSERFTDMLITQTWVMQDCYPLHREIYDRVDRFVEHCDRLGIPNPYSLHEIHLADQRWKDLHKNAVPSIIDFQSRDHYIAESEQVKNYQRAESVHVDNGDFVF